MQFICSLKRTLAFLAIFTDVSALRAQDGWSDALLRLQAASSLISPLFGQPLAAADFNHDGHPDGAVLLRHGTFARIEVLFQSHRVRSLSFTSNLAALAVSAVDVNQDGSPDLLIEDAFWRRPLFLWLNDGKGEFYAASVSDCLPISKGDRPELTSPLPGKECSALAEAHRVRSRQTIGYIEVESSLSSLIIPFRKFGWVFTRGHIFSNLVRGSPDRFPLSSRPGISC